MSLLSGFENIYVHIRTPSYINNRDRQVGRPTNHGDDDDDYDDDDDDDDGDDADDEDDDDGDDDGDGGDDLCIYLLQLGRGSQHCRGRCLISKTI